LGGKIPGHDPVGLILTIQSPTNGLLSFSFRVIVIVAKPAVGSNLEHPPDTTVATGVGVIVLTGITVGLRVGLGVGLGVGVVVGTSEKVDSIAGAGVVPGVEVKEEKTTAVITTTATIIITDKKAIPRLIYFL